MKPLAATPALVRRSMNLSPPFAFSGIRITHLDSLSAEVRLRQHRWNGNVAGVHFGGSLFAMTDPFWMILLLQHLGRDHLVWDRAAEVEFLKPGRGNVTACFVLAEEDVERIRTLAAGGSKVLEWFSVDVTDADGDVAARVRKQVYVWRKREDAAAPAAPAPAASPATWWPRRGRAVR